MAARQLPHQIRARLRALIKNHASADAEADNDEGTLQHTLASFLKATPAAANDDHVTSLAHWAERDYADRLTALVTRHAARAQSQREKDVIRSDVFHALSVSPAARGLYREGLWSSLAAYAAVACANRARNALRGQEQQCLVYAEEVLKHDPQTPESPEEFDIPDTPNLTWAADKELLSKTGLPAFFVQYLCRRSVKVRVAVLGRFLYGMSTHEIAMIVNMGPNAIDQAICKARRELRELLKDEQDN